MEAFVESVKALDESERGEMVLLFSAVSDKKYDQMIEYLCENLDVKAYVVTQIEDERGVPQRNLLMSSEDTQTDRTVKND